ncbi:MAG: hypothetical protein H7A46_14260 [Verrucomicrobiales bacterium]|nr:hypothetical protein [Verrucomicrobiales bacterium]
MRPASLRELTGTSPGWATPLRRILFGVAGIAPLHTIPATTPRHAGRPVRASNLRKQWHQELTEKFFLPGEILETKSFNAAIRTGHFRPFESDRIVICSYHFARNKADQRVYQLLAEKFQLFEGVFGASDEVLGSIESGVDFEKRIADIYQRCRKHEEIKTAFDQLQLELSFEIDEAMTRTRRQLLENFDNEVREKLRIRADASSASLNRLEKTLMRLTAHELNGHAEFADEFSFHLKDCPFSDLVSQVPTGRYELPRRTGEAHLYRLSHPWAEAVIAQAKARQLPAANVRFDYNAHEGRISILTPFVSKSGWLTLSRFTVESLDQAEDHLIFAAVTDDGIAMDPECAARLFTLPGDVAGPCPGSAPTTLETDAQRQRAEIQGEISERNARFFEAEAEKFEGWADDLKLGLEREIKEMDRQIKEARRAATTAMTLEEKLAGHKRIKNLESQRNEKRRSLFEAQDRVDAKRAELIANIEGRLAQQAGLLPLFTVRWSLSSTRVRP